MPAPIHRLKKSEILWLHKNYCKHGHRYLNHYECYLQENPDLDPRVGFFDIETTNLDADFGIMLSWCIKDGASRKIYSDVITREDIDNARAGDEDKRVVQSCVDAIASFDKIVTFYGKRFDVPFIRTRALICGIDFPYYGCLVHDDVYFMARNRLKLSSNRLENVCRALMDKTLKTRIEKRAWRAAGRGDPASLEYVLDHNRKDVIDLEKIYHKLINFTARRDTSL